MFPFIIITGIVTDIVVTVVVIISITIIVFMLLLLLLLFLLSLLSLSWYIYVMKPWCALYVSLYCYDIFMCNPFYNIHILYIRNYKKNDVNWYGGGPPIAMVFHLKIVLIVRYSVNEIKELDLEFGFEILLAIWHAPDYRNWYTLHSDNQMRLKCIHWLVSIIHTDMRLWYW